MSWSVAVVNLVLGLAYAGIGILTVIEMKRDWPTLGFTHFGAAFAGLAFTCGAHHLAHGFHVGFEGRAGGPLDLVTVTAGLPGGAIWLVLRVEAFAGGRGDRYIPGTPGWLAAAPTAAAVYVTALVAAVVGVPGLTLRLSTIASANAALVLIYLAIAWFLVCTQLRNRRPMRGWSLSGLLLSSLFSTCAVMHAVLAVYYLSGTYEADVHGYITASLSIPAGLYFLWVVRGLYRDSLRDWNRVSAQTPAAASASAAPAPAHALSAPAADSPV